jgi:hypothetical protein
VPTVRRAARVDENQKAITAALRAIGATVQPIHAIGRGTPDLLVGWQKINALLEIKDGSKPASARQLTDDEAQWIAAWRGSVRIVESVEQAVRAVLDWGKE